MWAGEYFELHAVRWVGRTLRRLPMPTATAQESYDYLKPKLFEGATPPPTSTRALASPERRTHEL